LLQLIDQVGHRTALLELEHERHILEQEPLRSGPTSRKAFEDFAHEAGLGADDASGPTSLAEILTGKARREHVNFRELL
jgi:hypothetical protein